ncbi:DUF222 domain-containing protein [Brachybacterium huguangmaarense]
MRNQDGTPESTKVGVTPAASGVRAALDASPDATPAVSLPSALEPALAALAALPGTGAARALAASLITAFLAALGEPLSARRPLAATEPGSADEALAVLATTDRFRSSLAAVDAAWQVRAAQRIAEEDARRELPADERGRAAAHEIALARRMSPASSSYSLAASRRLVAQLPGTFGLLASGRVTEQQARTISTALDGADPETAHAIDEALTREPGRLDGVGTRRLASEVRALRDAADPHDAAARAERAARSRSVTMKPLPDEMAAVTATLRAVDAVTVMNALRLEAESRRARGATGGVRALEADALVDVVLDGVLAGPDGSAAAVEERLDERWEALTDAAREQRSDRAASGTVSVPTGRMGSRRVEVGVIITDRALLAPETIDRPRRAAGADGGKRSGDSDGEARTSDDAGAGFGASRTPDGADPIAQLEGYGPVSARLIRSTLDGMPPGSFAGDPPEFRHPDATAGAMMRRLFTHPRTGELVAMESRARAFPATLQRAIRWRDETCATPWCNARVRHIDHITPYADGGPTSYANGQGLCERCNLIKEHGGWSVEIGAEASGTGSSIGTGATTRSVGGDAVGGDAVDSAMEPDRTATATISATSAAESTGATRPTVRWTGPHGSTGIRRRPPLAPPSP